MTYQDVSNALQTLIAKVEKVEVVCEKLSDIVVSLTDEYHVVGTTHKDLMNVVRKFSEFYENLIGGVSHLLEVAIESNTETKELVLQLIQKVDEEYVDKILEIVGNKEKQENE